MKTRFKNLERLVSAVKQTDAEWFKNGHSKRFEKLKTKSLVLLKKHTDELNQLLGDFSDDYWFVG